MATNQGMSSSSSRIPTTLGNLTVALSVDLLRAELNGSGLAKF
ncbi:MAG: hypothetical protein R3281_12815 [Balneolaceae bacterium]|nr:hypothetical protein [Balneolaceae bacterium]